MTLIFTIVCLRVSVVSTTVTVTAAITLDDDDYDENIEFNTLLNNKLIDEVKLD